jgi:anti-sigma regulatory factor (Ser/Thr protein kinase)
MEKVEKAVRPVLTSDAEVEAVKTAVAEAVMNAIEHGNGLRVELPVIVDVLVTAGDLVIRIADQGLGRGVPAATVPDLDAKLEGRQSPRGWGLFLIREMVDDVETKLEDGRHILELRVRLDNGKR